MCMIEGLDEFIPDYPIFEYRIINTENIDVYERVRKICENECTRYNKTWACPPGTGTLQECKAKIRSYSHALFFSSVAEVSDIMNFEELLSTRHAHEDLTDALADFVRSTGKDVFALSTESCDICPECAYPDQPCRFPDKMHPCLESYGVVVSEIVEQETMEYNLGGNTILWFSMILFRDSKDYSSL